MAPTRASEAERVFQWIGTNTEPRRTSPLERKRATQAAPTRLDPH